MLSLSVRMIVHWQQQKAEALKDLASIGKSWRVDRLLIGGIRCSLASRSSTGSKESLSF